MDPLTGEPSAGNLRANAITALRAAAHNRQELKAQTNDGPRQDRTSGLALGSLAVLHLAPKAPVT